MAQPTRPDSLPVLESQIRECYGRVVYSHKTHEKCSDIYLKRLSATKITQIILAALTTGGLLTVMFGQPDTSRLAAFVAALTSTVLLALNAYTKDVDPGATAQQHKETADRLWLLRESYLSLLADMRSGAVDDKEVRIRRDNLQADLAKAYESAPRTSPRAYAAASKALKVSEDLTFSDAEIDQFLPAPLRKE
jgi:hypothetical protein